MNKLDMARTQYRGLFRRMAAECMSWNLHNGINTVVLLREDALMDVPLPIILRDVQAMSEQTMINRLHNALSR
jgi:hypothetical protein